MNNILLTHPPETVVIGGKEYPIVSDYRTCLRVILAYEDSGLTAYEKQIVLLANLYPVLPPDAIEAVKQAMIFLNGGKDGDGRGSGPRVYSFEKDANLIYAAFYQTHHINLRDAKIHWWEFLSLFMDLGADTAFCNLVSLRRRVKTGKATKEERRAALEMGDMFYIPESDTRSIEEREAERLFDEAVAEGMRKRANAISNT